MKAVLENAVRFGEFNGLIGVVSERTERASGVEGTDRPSLTGVIILNTGIIHRVGAGRLSALLARRLAIAGHYVLRFDLSGIGDSQRRGDRLSPADGAMADLRDAVDWFHGARGIQGVILIGNCTGADFSLRYAGTDVRVVGMATIDAPTPPTRRHYLRKCMNPKVWQRKLKEISSWSKARRTHPEPPSIEDVWQYDDSLPLNHPRVHSLLADAYRRAFASSVRTLIIFTTGAAWYNYRNQLFDAFPDVDFTGNIQFEYFERCDHLISHEANRLRLYEVVESWISRTKFNLPMAASSQGKPRHEPPAAASDELVSVEF